MSNNRILGNLASYIDSSSDGGAITKSGNDFFIQAMTDSDVGGTPGTGFAGTDSASVKGLITTASVVQKSGRSKNATGLKNILQGEITKLNPSASATYNLGDSSNPIDEIILDSSATIFFGDISLTSILKSGTSTIAVAAVVPPSPVSGSAETSFLLKTDSTQTDAQVDASTNSATITENGDVKSTAFSPYHPKGYSSYFDGTGDYITVPSNSGAPFDFGTDNFTIEGWFYLTTSGSWTSYWGISEGGGSSQKINLYDASGDGTLDVDVNGSVVFSSSAVLTDLQNKWAHIALVREGTGTNQTKLYVNGSVVGQGTVSTNFSGFSQPFTVGHNGELYSGAFNGYISDFRVVNGTAVYTTDFTSPTERLTAITGTELLTCHLPYFADGSTNNQSITVTGNTKTEPFSPYDHIAYSPSSHGGSVYFDGNGDYMSLPANDGYNFGSNDFTLEAWVYVDLASISSNLPLVGWGTGSYKIIRLNSTGINVESNSPSNASFTVSFASSPITKTWNHIALVRSGNSFTAYLNGVGGTAYTSYTGNIGNGSDALNISYKSDPTYYTGYIADLRIVKGTAVYTANFTPPTEPLTAISGTQLLTCTNKHEVWDAASGDRLSLVGSADASTTQYKWSDSLYVTGGSDRLEVSNADWVIGTQDFTIEMWIRASGIVSGDAYVFYDQRNANDNINPAPCLYVNGMTVRYFVTGSDRIVSSSTLSNDTWYHVAVVRSSGTTTLYLDGTSQGTYSDSNNYIANSAGRPFIGGDARTQTIGWEGYIEDVRVTNGLARYTSNFTPPTAALEG